MRHEIRLPELGEGITEAFVAEWLVATGKAVRTGDAILDVVTDKANIEVESDADGVLAEHCVAEEERVTIGQLIGVVEVADGGGS
jgi:pyruvate/2-oxoglutarate dehydrogenase complex dihydrolipoamide acyltransferase (E2) component